MQFGIDHWNTKEFCPTGRGYGVYADYETSSALDSNRSYSLRRIHYPTTWQNPNVNPEGHRWRRLPAPSQWYLQSTVLLLDAEVGFLESVRPL